jgi:T-complex protein 1 subunit beta
MLMANAVEDLSKNTTGKKAIAMEAFARALRMIPTIIADNGGYDSSELVAQLRAEHYKGNKFAGLDMTNGIVGDVSKLRIVESFKVKQQILLSATEAAGNLFFVVIKHLRNGIES